MKKVKEIIVFYFSGTGNTAYLVEHVCEAFVDRGRDCSLSLINDEAKTVSEDLPSLFGICAPIYAWRLPGLVLEMLKNLPKGHGQQVFLLMTAGGGEGKSNLNASRAAVRILRRKGYKPFYVKTFLMSSNWMIRLSTEIVQLLADVLVEKIPSTVDSILKGEKRLPEYSATNTAILGTAGVMENAFGSKLFGRMLKADDSCTRCGLCVKDCPTGNIRMTEKGITFGWSCQWCMKCLYSCPEGAISPRFLKSCAVSEPYLLKNEFAKPVSGEKTGEVDDFILMHKDYFVGYSG